MRVLIAGAVADVLHEPRGRVTDVERHRLCGPLAHVRFRLVVSDVYGIRFWREREIERRLGQRQLTFRVAEEVVGLFSRERERERAGVGVADVLRREADEPPREIKTILAGLEHPREPVKRGVRIRIAQRFMEG